MELNLQSMMRHESCYPLLSSKESVSASTTTTALAAEEGSVPPESFVKNLVMAPMQEEGVLSSTALSVPEDEAPIYHKSHVHNNRSNNSGNTKLQ